MSRLIFFDKGMWREATQPVKTYSRPWICIPGTEVEPAKGDMIFDGCCSRGWPADLHKRGLSVRGAYWPHEVYPVVV